MDIARDLFHAQQVLVTLFLAANKLQMLGDQQLQDITLRQMLAIPALIHAPNGGATINHLARSLGTTKQSARQIVDALERKGYLSVAPSAQDRRAVHIIITPEGQRAFGVCSERTDGFLADIFQPFCGAELEALCALLQKLHRGGNAAAEGLHGHAGYDESDSEAILRHHPRFAEQRAHPRETD